MPSIESVTTQKENDTFLPFPTIYGDSVMKKLAFFLIAGLILASVGLAQTSAPKTKILTLDNAISAALERNITIQQAYASTSSAQSAVLAAYGSYSAVSLSQRQLAAHGNG